MCLVDINQVPDEEILSHVDLCVTAMAMKHIRSPELPQQVNRALSIQGPFDPKSAEIVDSLRQLLEYICTKSDKPPKEAVSTLLGDHVSEEIRGEIMSTLADQWLEKGRDEGIQRGIQKGRQEGRQEGLQKGGLVKARENVTSLGSLKFGPLPSETVDFIQSLSKEACEVLLKGTLTAQTIEEWLALVDAEK